MIRTYYADWSNNSSNNEPWKMAEVTIAADSDGDLEIYLVRPDSKRNTFLLKMGRLDAVRFCEEIKKVVEYE